MIGCKHAGQEAGRQAHLHDALGYECWSNESPSQTINASRIQLLQRSGGEKPAQAQGQVSEAPEETGKGHAATFGTVGRVGRKIIRKHQRYLCLCSEESK